MLTPESSVYETYYLQTFLHGHCPSTVAWIGSIQAFAQFSAALLSGPLTDRYGPMVVVWPFSLLLVVAMMLASLFTELYQFIPVREFSWVSRVDLFLHLRSRLLVNTSSRSVRWLCRLLRLVPRSVLWCSLSC